jgi:hypothetical protein
MVKNNSNVLLLVGLMVIVGIIASVVISVGITGNVISVNKYPTSNITALVYTKGEVDSLITGINGNITRINSSLTTTQIRLNNTITMVIRLTNMTLSNRTTNATIVGNWSRPGNVTIIITNGTRGNSTF